MYQTTQCICVYSTADVTYVRMSHCTENYRTTYVCTVCSRTLQMTVIYCTSVYSGLHSLPSLQLLPFMSYCLCRNSIAATQRKPTKRAWISAGPGKRKTRQNWRRLTNNKGTEQLRVEKDCTDTVSDECL